ncbi:hypothetical protein AB0M12_11850 [Nocardia vinacea]|uniref:hypothetical protein n=2 Tax=Nocardia vinacea TaxID=96468 RepID=UPI00342439C4
MRNGLVELGPKRNTTSARAIEEIKADDRGAGSAVHPQKAGSSMPRTILYPSDELIRTVTATLLGANEQSDSTPLFFGLTLAGPDQIGVLTAPTSADPPFQDLATLVFSRAPRKTLWGFGFHAEAAVMRTADARGNLWSASREHPGADVVETFRSADHGVPDDPIDRELWVAAVALAAL